MIAKSLRLFGCLLTASLATSVLIPSLSAGIRVEVFIDNDKGYGNGTLFGAQIGDNSLEIPMEGVSEGTHTISFRTKDDSGSWSTTITRILYVFTSQNVENGEYYIDNDPGEGNGHSIPVTENNVTSFIVPTGTLSVGPHTLTVRLMKNGAWGESMTKSFVVTPSSLLYEWFFDTDPGLGQAFQKEATAGDNIFVLPTESLKPGAHLFSSRVRNTAGRWSTTVSRPIYVTEKVTGIISAEYFVDSDPGEGYGNHVTLSDGGEAAFIVPTDNLSAGMHSLTLRGRDASGKWYELFCAPFSVVENSGVNSVEWKMQFNIYREGDCLKLLTEDIENGSEITIVNLQGVVLYESTLTDTSEPQLLPINPSNGYIIVNITSPDGKRSAKLVKI